MYLLYHHPERGTKPQQPKTGVLAPASPVP